MVQLVWQDKHLFLALTLAVSMESGCGKTLFKRMSSLRVK